MTPKPSESKTISSRLSQPIRRLLIVCFCLIALVPISLLGVKLYRAAWDKA